MRCFQTVLIALFATLQAKGAESESELMGEFRRCLRSLSNLRSLSGSDQVTISNLRARFDASSGLSAEGSAATLQLSLWIEDDASVEGQGRIQQDWQTLLAATPENSAVASGYINWQARVGLLEGPALLEARRSLLTRFPGSTEMGLEVAEGLRREIDCQAAIEVLVNLGEDAPAKAKVLLAQAYFDENRFGKASEVLAAINLEAIEDVAVRAQANNIVRQCEEINPLWEAELAIRAKEEAADNLPRVEIQTAKGSILIELFEDDAPNTVANFISLAQTDYYDGIAFHRFEPNFMIQGGCPNTKSGEGTYGTGGPGYTIADECKGDNARLHFADSVAMAKTSAPDTGGSQFYLNHRPTTWLNNRHTVFGRVLEGRDVACKLRKDDVIEDIAIVRLRDGSTYVPETIENASAPAATTDEGKSRTEGEAKEGS